MTAAPTVERPSRCACWRPTARWPRATCRRSTATRCSTRGARCCARASCDERCFSLQRQGRLGTFSPVNGEEAAVVGSAWALDPARDWVVPQYRELPAMLRQGYR